MSSSMGLGVGSVPMNIGAYSPAKEKAGMRGSHHRLLAQRLRQLLTHIGSVKIKLLLPFFLIFTLIVIAGRAASFMGWHHHSPHPRSRYSIKYPFHFLQSVVW